ncbi:MAG: hypothetical protein IPH45_07625 [Bacteroidales bacterium]|nr:hypothetical protein [Bacteroidales bacterium]
MLENLLQLVKENAGEAIINNPVIPNEKNDEAISTASNSIFSSLQEQVQSGGLDSITGLFSGGSSASGNLVNGISGKAVGDLMNKFGIDSGAATQIASQLIPTVMNKLVSKTNDPNDSSFDLQGILGSLTGGKSGGLMDTVKGIFG